MYVLQKSMIRVLCCFLLISSLNLTTNHSIQWVQAQVQYYEPNLPVFMNGKEVTFDVKPIIMEGRTLVPLRKLFEELGATIEWNSQEQMVIARNMDTEIKLVVGDEWAWVNGTPVQLDVPSKIINNRTLIPLRFVSEALGAIVDYDQSIYITKQGEARIDLFTDEFYNNLVEKGRTKEAVLEQWEIYRNKYEGNVTSDDYFEERPTVHTDDRDHKAGRLNSQVLQDALNMVNFARYLAGMPEDVVLDEEYNNYAQHAVTLLGAYDLLTHTPTKRDDMTEAFFDTAYTGTSRSNLWSCRQCRVSHGIIAFLDDYGLNNRERVGHRRHILKPQLAKVGFGHALTETQKNPVAMLVIGDYRTEKVDYEYVAWPSPGYFPEAFLRASESWSIDLNPERYQPITDQIIIEVTNVVTGSKEILNKNSGNVFFYESHGLVFIPSNTEDGHIFEVRITGLRDHFGNAREINYSTIFFDSLNVY